MTTNKTAKIQFYEGTDEPVVPEIRLTRVRMAPPAKLYFCSKNLRHYLQLLMVKSQVCV